MPDTVLVLSTDSSTQVQSTVVPSIAVCTVVCTALSVPSIAVCTVLLVQSTALSELSTVLLEPGSQATVVG